MELSSPKKLNKTFSYSYIKFLRRNWLLEQSLLITGCSSNQFFNSFFVTYGTPFPARGHRSHFLKSYLGKQRISLGVQVS